MKFAKIRISLLFSLLFLACPLFGQSKTDVVLMKNGDRMTCEIKGLEGGVLFVSLDYVDGTIQVQWSKVARLESSRLFIVKTENGSIYKGKISTAEASGSEPIKIEVAETPDKKTEIDTAKVVAMDTTSKRLLQRFNGDINFGMIYSKGNQSTQYNVSGLVEYPADRWSAHASFNSTLSSNSGSETSERNQMDISVRRLLRKKNYFYSGAGSFLQSSEQGINLQTSIGGGIGHYFRNTNRARIAVIGGLAWQRTNYNDASTTLATQNVSAAIIATEIKFFKFKKTNFNITANFLPSISEPGRVYFKLNQSYYIKLFSNLAWNISFYGDWDNRPPGGLPSSDFGTSTGLGWTFGNK